MRAATHIGTSGWQYGHWKEVFYPKKLKQKEWLEYYARYFDCVEVNSSFYGLPTVETIAAWCEHVPARFIFSVKAPRRITHFKKLKNCEAELRELFRRLETFDRHLGPVLFQLPPRWRCNLGRLEGFISALPSGRRVAFEFRDPSWHNEDVYALLESRSMAFCIFDSGGFTAPIVDRGNLVYVRLHGPVAAYTGSYRAPRLRIWVDRAQAWNRRNKEVFIFFDNDERGYAVKNGARTIGLLKAA
ncbi:MAG: DUF72 domain-containing protein [Gammaproteobacteria bacterium]|nr:DUF72 domain-containing protein [Gammaproteobacteria bacterium]NIM74792.1 DUF72 domain-containing protein [Gammaproteobacteria bacterium]NIN39223.1 DUF72 domain-containing protein [Gammaproteobacteria bacterium]NIO26709.1 DUF72 domain-containing protein [Gammaproteobacteria bacterium]NIO67265.1 DUF72 domain-containing protein [Gammaproteobacteria bacterium]